MRLAGASIYALGCMLLASPAQAAELEGVWRTEDDQSHITITTCNGSYCGTITALLEPFDDAGLPKRDEQNPDPAKRNQPLIGLRIITGMTPADTPGRWEGEIYNPEDGDIYQASLELHPKGLKVEGCFALVFCRSQIWTRVESP